MSAKGVTGLRRRLRREEKEELLRCSHRKTTVWHKGKLVMFMKVNVVYNKSCVSMDEVDDNSVDTIFTSPPYWGLRDYGKGANQIWGGDPECEHQWSDKLVVKERGSVMGPTAQVRNQRNPEIAKTHSTRGQFCQKCGSWYGQLGLEPTLEMYIEHLLLITAECKRVLKPTGVLWWNHGDCYFTGKGSCNNPGGGNKSWKSWNDRKAIFPRGKGAPNRMSKEIPAKCLALQNFRLIIRLIDEQGWILRNTAIWEKPNSMPSSTKDRLTNKYEPVFFLVKNKKYWFDLDAIRIAHFDKYGMARRGRTGEGKSISQEESLKVGKHFKIKKGGRDYNSSGKNPGDVWTIPTQPYPEAHFATFPEKLVIKPILSSCPEWICKKCGKARVRITRKDNPDHTGKTGSEYKTGQNANRLALLRQAARERGEEFVNKTMTIGWTNCGCNAGWRPGITLDLFAGSGTTLAVAKKHGRQFIGYEIVKSYIPLIRKRLAEEDTMFNRDLKEQFV